MKKLAFKIIFFVTILVLHSCSPSNEEQTKLSKPKIDWKVGDVKSILIESKWQNSSGGSVLKKGINSDNFEIRVLDKVDDIYELEVTHQFDSLTSDSLMSNYLMNSKENPEMYLKADWQESFVRLFPKFKILYNYETGTLNLEQSSKDLSKIYLDSLMNLAIENNYNLKDWKNIQDHISLNLDSQEDILKKVIPLSFDLIFDFYQLEYSINEEHKFNDRTHLFADMANRPIDLKLKHNQSDNTFAISIDNIEKIKEINEENIPVISSLNSQMGDDTRWTVTQIDTTSNSKFIYNINTTWLESIVVNRMEHDLFDGSQIERVITISIQ